MKKRILSIFLAMVMVFTMIPSYTISSFALASGDFEYEVLDETAKTAAITKYTGTATDLEFPAELDGYTITEIKLYSIFSFYKFVNVVLPEGVTTISSYGFANCSSLVTIKLPISLTSIASSAFSGCNSLESVLYCGTEEEWNAIEIAGNNDCLTNATITFSVPKSSFEYEVLEDGTAKIIGYSGFANSIEIPSEIDGYIVTAIGYGAFFESSAKKVVLPETVTSIGTCSFLEMSNLTEIIVPDSVTSIGDRAFEGTALYNNSSNWEDGVLYIGNHLIKASNETPSEYAIKSGTKTIAARAFETCTSITSVVIPDSMTTINQYAFQACKNLETVTIPNSITKFDIYAFAGCTSLTNVTIPNSITSIEAYAFAGCDSLISITIPESVTSIGKMAFYECYSLINIMIPDSVTSMGEGVFFDSGFYNDETNWEDGVLYVCNHLVGIAYKISGKLEVKPGTITIADWVFYECEELKEIILPDSLVAIGCYSFCECESLISIDLPNGFTTIGDGAFGRCTRLVSINIPESVTTIGNSAFSSCKSLMNIIVPGSVTTIGMNAFYSSGLVRVVLLDGITTIDKSAFNQCSSLNSIVFPESVTLIGNSAFAGCSALESVVYGSSEEKWNAIDIAENNDCLKNATIVYGGEYSLEYEVLEDGTAKIIGFTGFDFEFDIPSVIDGYNVTAIGDNAFEECQAVNIVLPNTITSIGNLAFYNMFNLTEIIIPDSVTTIGIGAFACCVSLTEVNIPDSVASIGDYAFLYCRLLNNIEVDESNENYSSIDGVLFDKDVTTLMHYPLSKVGFDYVIPESVTTISMYAFLECNYLKNITIHNNLKAIGDMSFCNCSSLTNIYYSGTKCQWDSISIGESNNSLTNATINYALGEHAYGEYEFPTEAGLGVMGEAKHTCEYCGNEESCTYQLGDVDGDELYTENDYAMIIQASACGIALTEQQRIIGDIDGDGAVDTFDAMALDVYMN